MTGYFGVRFERHRQPVDRRSSSLDSALSALDQSQLLQPLGGTPDRLIRPGNRLGYAEVGHVGVESGSAICLVADVHQHLVLGCVEVELFDRLEPSELAERCHFAARTVDSSASASRSRDRIARFSLRSFRTCSRQYAGSSSSGVSSAIIVASLGISLGLSWRLPAQSGEVQFTG